MTTKRSKNMLNTIVKISQSLLEHHFKKKSLLNHIQNIGQTKDLNKIF